MNEFVTVALQVLEPHPEGLSYRDLVQSVASRLPELSRVELTQLVGDLPKAYPELIWRPRPGYFAVRTERDLIRRVGRPPKREAADKPDQTRWPARPLPNRVENLKRLGFTEVGFWMRTSEGLECRYTGEFDPKQALLAYVLNDNVVYISRTRGHNLSPSNPGRVARAIRAALNRDQGVRVYALNTWDEVSYQGMPVNVAAGIEDELVERMQPPWNEL
jgi:hypothetical protein